jgi:alpha-amylase
MAPRVPALGLIGLALLLVGGCSSAVRSVGERRADTSAALSPSAFWNSATIYFLLPDRFQNGDPGNDRALGRAHDAGLLRNFEGGDLAGVRRRIDEG